MTVSINGDQKVLADVTNNVTQVLQWVNISPVASTLTFDLTDTNGGGICMINALEISWFEN
jgi:K+-transporting ATPase A subunit